MIMIMIIIIIIIIIIISGSSSDSIRLLRYKAVQQTDTRKDSTVKRQKT